MRRATDLGRRVLGGVVCGAVLVVVGVTVFLRERTPGGAASLSVRGHPLSRLPICRVAELPVAEGTLFGVWDKIRLPASAQWPDLVHALRFWDTTVFPGAGGWSREKVLQRFCDSALFEQEFGKTPFHQVTQHGLKVRTLDRAERDKTDRVGDAHTDQTVCVLGTLGVSSSQAIRVRGRDFAMADVVRYAAANCSAGHEMPWTAVALALYLPPKARWVNKFGQTYTMDEVCRDVLQVELGQGPCYGMHTLEALTVLLYVDGEERTLRAGTRHQASRFLAEALGALEGSQRGNGSWGPEWAGNPVPDGAPTAGREALKWRISLTAHALEWLAVAPEEFRVDGKRIHAACEFLTRTILAEPASEIESAFAEHSHAGNALKVWFPESWKRWTDRTVRSRSAKP